MNKQTFLLIMIIGLALIGSQSMYTVDQTQRALVLQLGKPVGGIMEPGLHFKIPLVQSVMKFDSRLLLYDAPPAEIITADKKTLVVDFFAKWRIIDPLVFYQRLQTYNQAHNRLDKIIRSDVREALGRYTLHQIVSEKRDQVMEQATIRASGSISGFGIEVVDVRIKRTDLPDENENAIFERMRAERNRQAKQYRSEGEEEAAKIRSQADKERMIILAEAQRESETTRGEGDANATAIYATALEQAPEFYSFKRSLEAYVRGFRDKTRIILTPESEFMQHFK